MHDQSMDIHVQFLLNIYNNNNIRTLKLEFKKILNVHFRINITHTVYVYIYIYIYICIIPLWTP